MDVLHELLIKTIKKKGEILSIEEDEVLLAPHITVRDRKTKTKLSLCFYFFSNTLHLSSIEWENYKKIRASMFLQEIKQDLEEELKKDSRFRIRVLFDTSPIHTTSDVLNERQIDELIKSSTFKEQWKDEKKYLSKLSFFALFLTLFSLSYAVYSCFHSGLNWFSGFLILFNLGTLSLNFYNLSRPVIRSLRNSIWLEKYK